jgi:hypothetical protein
VAELATPTVPREGAQSEHIHIAEAVCARDIAAAVIAICEYLKTASAGSMPTFPAPETVVAREAPQKQSGPKK